MGFHKDVTGRGLHEPATYKIKNNTGATLAKGKVLKRAGFDSVITGAVSGNPVSDSRIGIVLDAIADGAIGYVASQGDFGQFDTSAFTVEDVLYSDGSGNLTTTVSGSAIATVLQVDATDGHLFCYVAIPISVSGGGASPYSVHTAAITATDVTNGFVTLPATPATPASTILMYEGAPDQIYGIDYTVSGALLSFTGIAPFVESGDSITVLFK